MHPAIAFLFFVAASFVVAAFGAQFMPGPWYEQLAKPAWNPPNWLFGPVWTTLYISIAVSGWLVWRRSGLAWNATFGVFALQLLLNAVWSWLFFGLHSPGWAFMDIVLLWLAILATVVLFWREAWQAGALLLPYFAWVSFAALLNWTLWRLNS